MCTEWSSLVSDGFYVIYIHISVSSQSICAIFFSASTSNPRTFTPHTANFARLSIRFKASYTLMHRPKLRHAELFSILLYGFRGRAVLDASNRHTELDPHPSLDSILSVLYSIETSSNAYLHFTLVLWDTRRLR